MTPMRLVALTGLVVLAACGGGGPTQPAAVPGDLIVSVTAPSADVGALLIRVVGKVTNVTPVGSYHLSFKGDSVLTRVVVTGSVTSGDLLKIHVPDVEKFANYSAFAEQVASGTDYSLLSTSGFVFAIRK